MNNMIKLDLQLFAEGAGHLVNTTQNYVNAYNGTAISFHGTDTLAPEIKQFYDLTLLDKARPNLRYHKFAKKKNIPQGHGHTIEFRTVNKFVNAEQLTEGVIPAGQKAGVSHITATVNQFGLYTAVSDMLELQSIDDLILAFTEEMGYSASNTIDLLMRDALLVGTNVLYCDNINAATGAVISTPTSCATMHSVRSNTTNGFAALTVNAVQKAVTALKAADAKPFEDGKYVAIIHPYTAYDIMQDPNWVDAHKYAQPKELYDGELGEIAGVRFVESTNAPILNSTLYKNAEETSTFATFIFGPDAYGASALEGAAMETIVKPKEMIGGPLNQFSTIGYKLTFGGVILQPTALIRVMSCSEYSATATPN